MSSSSPLCHSSELVFRLLWDIRMPREWVLTSTHHCHCNGPKLGSTNCHCPARRQGGHMQAEGRIPHPLSKQPPVGTMTESKQLPPTALQAMKRLRTQLHVVARRLGHPMAAACVLEDLPLTRSPFTVSAISLLFSPSVAVSSNEDRYRCTST